MRKFLFYHFFLSFTDAIQTTIYYALPTILFGGISIIGAILVLFSPETYEKELPETLAEAKHL